MNKERTIFHYLPKNCKKPCFYAIFTEQKKLNKNPNKNSFASFFLTKRKTPIVVIPRRESVERNYSAAGASSAGASSTGASA